MSQDVQRPTEAVVASSDMVIVVCNTATMHTTFSKSEHTARVVSENNITAFTMFELR